jgi:hypothetical protein
LSLVGYSEFRKNSAKTSAVFSAIAERDSKIRGKAPKEGVAAMYRIVVDVASQADKKMLVG